jgi:hypothetical protein
VPKSANEVDFTILLITVLIDYIICLAKIALGRVGPGFCALEADSTGGIGIRRGYFYPEGAAGQRGDREKSGRSRGHFLYNENLGPHIKLTPCPQANLNPWTSHKHDGSTAKILANLV